MCANLLQSYLTLCDLVDYSPSRLLSVHGILQTRILEWVVMPSSRGSAQLRDWAHVSYISCICRQVLYHGCHLGSPLLTVLISHGSYNRWAIPCLFTAVYLCWRGLEVQRGHGREAPWKRNCSVYRCSFSYRAGEVGMKVDWKGSKRNGPKEA